MSLTLRGSVLANLLNVTPTDGLFPTSDQLARREPVAAVRGRCRAALIGSFVADAACMGLHWVPATVIAEELEARGTLYRPEFQDPPLCRKYRYMLGSLSALGEEIMPVLQSLIKHGGFYGPHMLATTTTFFNKQVGYKAPMYKGICHLHEIGIVYPWAAAVDCQVHCLLKVPVMTARYAGKGKENLAAKMAAAVLVHQDHSIARAAGVAAALMLERVILGQSIAEMLVWASTEGNLERAPLTWVQEALKAQNQPHTEAVRAFGTDSMAMSCFKGIVHALACSASYADGVRQSLLAGGENVGRACLVGAFFAAQDGEDAIPPQWSERVLILEELSGWADQLVSQRTIIDLMS